MPYIGRDLNRGNYLKLDDISSSFNSSTTTFNLTVGGSAFTPGSAFSILVSLGGVIQEPESAYQVNNSEITFANAPTAQDSFFCIALGVALGIGVPGNGTVNGTQMAKPFNYDGYFYLDDANNRVGIGSLQPKQALDIIGNTNISGILTASSFSGPVVGNTNNTSGISTFYDLKVTNNLTVEGTTTTLDTNLIGVDRVEVGANSNTIVGVAITQSGTADIVNLFDGGTNVLTVTDTGDVGIGTNNPTGKLSIASGAFQTTTPTATGDDIVISGNNSLGMQFLTLASNTSNNNIYFGDTDDPDVGMIRYAHADNSMQFRTNTEEALRITSGGSVGIGTDSPNGSSLGTNTGLVHLKDMGSGNTALKVQHGSVHAYFAADNNDLTIATRSDHPIQFQTNNVERIRIGSNGSVGIGTDHLSGNASVYHKLMVEGDTTSQIAVAKILRRNSGASNSTYTFEIDSSAHTSNMTNGGAMSVDVYSGRAFTIDGNGKVGIGTATPVTELDVNGDITIAEKIIHAGDSNTFISFSGDDTFAIDTAGSERLEINSSGTGRFKGGAFLLTNGRLNVNYDVSHSSTYYLNNDAQILVTNGDSSGTKKSVLKLGGEAALVYGSGSSSLIIADRENERLRIDSSGRILIGHDSTPHAAASVAIVGSYAGGATNTPFVYLCRDEAATAISGGESLGQILFASNDGYRGAVIEANAAGAWSGSSSDGYLVFKTTPDNDTVPEERLRITSDGILQVSTNKASGYVAEFDQDNTSNSAQILINSPTDANSRPSLIDFARSGNIKWSAGMGYNDTYNGFHISAGSLSANTSNSKFVITSDGYTGIGNYAGAATDPVVSLLQVTTNWDNGGVPMVHFKGANNEAPTNGNSGGNISFQISDENDNLLHKVWNTGGGGNDLGKVYYAGNLGINNTNPQEKLQIAGNISLGNRADNSSRYIGKGTNGDGGVIGDASANGNSCWIGFVSGTGNNQEDQLRFGTHKSGVSGGEKLRIDGQGHILIPGSQTVSDQTGMLDIYHTSPAEIDSPHIRLWGPSNQDARIEFGSETNAGEGAYISYNDADEGLYIGSRMATYSEIHLCTAMNDLNPHLQIGDGNNGTTNEYPYAKLSINNDGRSVFRTSQTFDREAHTKGGTVYGGGAASGANTFNNGMMQFHCNTPVRGSDTAYTFWVQTSDAYPNASNYLDIDIANAAMYRVLIKGSNSSDTADIAQFLIYGLANNDGQRPPVIEQVTTSPPSFNGDSGSFSPDFHRNSGSFSCIVKGFGTSGGTRGSLGTYGTTLRFQYSGNNNQGLIAHIERWY